jgi:hypothetical protein
MSDVVYLIVAVEGTEGQPDAVHAVENLSNAEQTFTVTQARTYDSKDLEEVGEPILYIP